MSTDEDQQRKFYQQIQWLDLKATILDEPAYSSSIHDHLRGAGIRTVLEAGMGTGLFTEKLTHLLNPNKLIGFDIDDNLVARAAERFGGRPQVRAIQQDLYRITDEEISAGGFDLIAGQALLEHTDLPVALAKLRDLTKPGGLLYFPMNYDSPWILEPRLDSDDRILDIFNRHGIENQQFGDYRCGDSCCGRHLWHACQSAELNVLEIANSDWILYPRGGGYDIDQIEILNILIGFFSDPDLHRLAFDRDGRDERELDEWQSELRRWSEVRRRQAANHQLVFICRQNSVLAQRDH